MRHRFTVREKQRWRENEYEGAVIGTVQGHVLTCYVQLPSAASWDDFGAGATLAGRLFLERRGEVRRTSEARPALQQVGGVSYHVVGRIEAIDDEVLRLESILPVSFELDPVPSVPLPPLQPGDWIDVTGVLSFEIAEADPDPCGSPSPFDLLSPEDSALPQAGQPFSWSSYRRFILEHRRKLGRRGDHHLGREAIPAALNREVFEELPRAYRDRLPVYHLATCPLCQGQVWEAIDTFSLMGIGWWRDEPLGFGWYGRPVSNPDIRGSYLDLPRDPRPSYQHTCDCVRAVTYGVNLHQRQPEDVTNNFVMLGSERPGLLVPFMRQAGSVAVIRTLPVGGWGATAWSARYTLYVVVYFHANPDSYAASFGDNAPSSPRFHWPYDALDYALESYLLQRKLLLHPTTTADDVLSLRGVTGRWCVRGRALKLLPITLVGARLLRQSHPAYAELAAREAEALRDRSR